MIKKLFQTTATRAISAFLGLLILSINAHFIGSEGVGETALFNLWVSIFLMIGNLLGGSAMVYYAPRYKVSELLTGAYVWAMVGLGILGVTSALWREVLPDVRYLAVVVFFYATGWAQQYLLVGRDKIHLHNAASLSVNGVLIASLVIQYHLFRPDVRQYFLSLSLGAAAQWLLSFIFLWPDVKSEKFSFRLNFEVVFRLLKDGFHIQIGNLIQQLNYRFTYFFLDKWLGTGAVGIFSTVVQLGEGIWLLAKSASLVVYSRVSQSGRDVNAGIITFVTARWVGLMSAVAMLVLAFLPNSFFLIFLGKDFSGVAKWLLAMTPAVAILAAGMVYSHYIAGRGMFVANFLISLTAFVPVATLSSFFIKHFGLFGAIAVNTISYTITTVGSFMLLLRYVHPDSKAYIWRFKPDFAILREYVLSFKKDEDQSPK
ncbi:MAG: lipopolysaccharide biosynthesis protein [Thermaurantimonas sp.]|uniref:lipopolysaccharide biosynthesis protein n=1 Tax=Thermaurantimonas sp. TaxID=2681568 RepID=UPI00391CB301